MSNLINLEKWRVLSEKTKTEMGSLLGMADHPNSYPYLQKKGWSNDRFIKNATERTGLSIDQLRDNEVFYRSFIICRDKSNIELVEKIKFELNCSNIENPFFYSIFVTKIILTINSEETMLRHKFNYDDALAEQHEIIKSINYFLKLHNVKYEETYLSHINYQYFRRF